MRILAIVHELDTGPGVFGEAIQDAGHTLDRWIPPQEPEPAADPLGYDAVLTLGGAMDADQEDRHPWLAGELTLLRDLLEAEVPLLGLCLGGQLLAAAAGAPPRRARQPEIGWYRVELTPEGEADPLMGALAPGFETFQWHSYEFPLSPGAVALARSEVCLQAAQVGAAAWALQFHPEVSADDAQTWIANYRPSEATERIGVDPKALATETEAKIPTFHQLGRDLCRRWLQTAG